MALFAQIFFSPSWTHDRYSVSICMRYLYLYKANEHHLLVGNDKLKKNPVTFVDSLSFNQ